MVEKTQMPTRQKIIAIVIVIVLIIIIWQIIGLFRGPTTPAPVATSTAPTPTPPGAPGAPRPPQTFAGALTPRIPTPVEVPSLQPMTEREAALIRVQQETQDQYLQAINELQVLKIQRDIATTIKDISTARLQRVEAEKKIIDTLSPPPPPEPEPTPPPAPPTPPPVATAPGGPAIETIAPGAGPPQAAQVIQPALPAKPEVHYAVVSVSFIQRRWSAVINHQGNLYNVHVGDILPPDGSRVTAIGRSGVILQKNGVKKKVSLITSL